MSSVIKFLERMGADAQMRHASQQDIAQALEESKVDAALGAAITSYATSSDELYSLLGLKPMFHVLENPGREEEEEEEEGEEEGGESKDALAASVVTSRARTTLA